MLQSDPWSVYRRNKCRNEPYAFSFDVLDVNCRFEFSPRVVRVDSGSRSGSQPEPDDRDSNWNLPVDSLSESDPEAEEVVYVESVAPTRLPPGSRPGPTTVTVTGRRRTRAPATATGRRPAGWPQAHDQRPGGPGAEGCRFQLEVSR